ncbi:efflux RND transporter periplasmic adaptor subunit [Erwiniaceae bacterium BAC15a-03b]|uniref:Efflux RND transporter periplasmic adaptor subunit n=1 Tax=Winslowiella arboricola TaxID=2978220 RepID=A0A9J6PN27_9GAMM|nr:efflux RND transporter periplasmic adaptor subunit [Winslowiella arboricola]MCU5775437.1 efflux RND transporter periplasmic adaptor subunit [Winslowiella arboricola]MCU5779713.1 efflux RND transporter periplasmic adaptor subunit [Winslowiella arboricola]
MMKTQTNIIAGALLLTGAIAAGYFAGKAVQPAAVPQSPAAEKRVLYWYDPMSPDQHFTKPGKSPFMDMDLVPRYAEADAEQSGVTITARQQQNLGVRTAEVIQKTLDVQTHAFATVQNNQRNMQIIAARAGGLIEELYVSAPQQSVHKGQPLARLWIPEWAAAQQEYLAVRQLRDSALNAAARQRLALLFMPQEIIREVERSGKPQPRVVIRAPENGYISKLEVRKGAQVASMQALFELASLDQLWIVIDYPASNADNVKTGRLVTVSADGWPGKQFYGEVTELLPSLDSSSRTLQARVTLSNHDLQLKPGMTLSATIAADAAPQQVIAIPQEALISSGSDNRVLLAEDNGFFRPVAVTTGRSQHGWTEISSGLQPGQRVVTSGQFLIDSEASLRSGLAQMQAPESASAPADAAQHKEHH